LERGVPLTLIAEAVFARVLSSLKDERVAAARVLRGPGTSGGSFDRMGQLKDLEEALYAAKIVSYAQGFMLLRKASDDLGWQVPLGTVPRLWRGGCVIRSRFLGDIATAYEEDPELANLMTAPFFARELVACQAGWRRTLWRAIAAGVPVPALSAALAFYDGYRAERLPANLIQAQRDYFGAHTYERVDAPRGQRFHTDWTGRGGRVTAESYEVERGPQSGRERGHAGVGLRARPRRGPPGSAGAPDAPGAARPPPAGEPDASVTLRRGRTN